MKTRFLLLVFSFLLIAPQLSSARMMMPARIWRTYLLSTNPSQGTVRRHPPLRHDSRIVPEMLLASKIAGARAVAHPSLLCWRYVKNALLRAHAVQSYPSTIYAREAGAELVSHHGFVRLPINNPDLAPVGSVLVYSGHGPGHVEIRTENGFVSDFRSSRACPWQLIGIYTKLSPATAS